MLDMRFCCGTVTLVVPLSGTSMADPTVHLTGTLLASLIFQHVNCESDVEGLILGENKLEEQVTISDSQADHIHIDETYNVQKHVSCLKLNNFYNSSGEVDTATVTKILSDNKQSLIGWYRQRRNSDQQMTFREKLVHENLKNAMSSPHIVFMLLTTEALTPSGSTHRTEYAAFISHKRRFMKVPVRVSNLGSVEQLAYWMRSTPCAAAGFNRTMRKHSPKFFSPNGFLREVNEVNDMNDALQSELQKTCSDVVESEQLLAKLLADVSALRRRTDEKRQRGTGNALCPAGQHDNVQLQEAVRRLFAATPLFHTQTLTLEAFPVPHGHEPAMVQEMVCVLRPGTRKRVTETTERGERKRRKSKS